MCRCLLDLDGMRLHRWARCKRQAVPGEERHRHAASYHVLRHRLPGLVLLGLTKHKHLIKSTDDSPEINIKPCDTLQKELDSPESDKKRVEMIG
uniref:Uncharacterized protein n=1 Tax=Arundo donax TaxID=35708 RepID=A0A0A9G2K8_ARUDO